MELSQYAKVVWRWLWLIVLGTVVAAGSMYLSVRGQPPQYRAKATLMIGTMLRQQEPSATDLSVAQDLARTYSDIAQREPVREATMRALNLTWLPYYSASGVVGTQLLEIQVLDTDPERVAAVANELASQLMLQGPANQAAKEADRRVFVNEQLKRLEASIDLAYAEIARLQEELATQFSAREISDTKSQIASLQQKMRDDQTSYGVFLGYLGEGAVNALSIIEKAKVPRAPVGPNKVRTVLTGMAVGLVLALATAFLLEYLDDTIKTPEDVQGTMGLTTQAGISRIPGKELEGRLITVLQPRSPISEGYRVLRTNLQFSSLDRPLGTLLVTSPNPSEGKSTTVANLGVVMARSGKSVILVDADMRRPVLHRIFGMDNRRGLTDVLLSAELSLDGVLRPTGVENLLLLSTGPLPPNPSELLGSQRMGALIERLGKEADVVLFDSPPSLAVTDASVLATKMDGVLLVADAGRTRRSLAKESADRLRRVGANLVGVVLNRLQPKRGGYYYYYYYYYGRAGRRRRRGWRGQVLNRPKEEPTATDAVALPQREQSRPQEWPTAERTTRPRRAGATVDTCLLTGLAFAAAAPVAVFLFLQFFSNLTLWEYYWSAYYYWSLVFMAAAFLVGTLAGLLLLPRRRAGTRRQFVWAGLVVLWLALVVLCVWLLSAGS